MSTLTEGWKEFYSPRAQAPYYVNGTTGTTTWERPDEPGAKRARVEGLDGGPAGNPSSGADAAALEKMVQGIQEQHAAEVANLKGKILELSATGSVAAGHHAQHGHVAFTTSEEPLPPQPTIITQHDPSHEKEVKWTRADLLVNETLAEIYRTESCVDRDGITVKFEDGVDPLEGKHLYNLVKENPRFLRTCEVGCAMGTSALYLCQAMQGREGALHVACDPNQDTQYRGIARANLQRAGLDSMFRLIHEPNYLGLSTLVRETRTGVLPGRFHLVFVDGWHTFDYTLLDLFFADLLTEVGGIICLDDINHKGVQKALKWVRTNLDHLEYIEKTPAAATMATFVKRADDTREWSHYKNF